MPPYQCLMKVGRVSRLHNVPARNTVFLSLALAWAEVLQAEAIFIGVNAIDYSLTVSCYRADGTGRACGQCDACRFRQEGFEQARLPDPTRYWG